MLVSEAVSKIRHRSIMPEERLRVLFHLAQSLGSVAGDFGEVGSYRGGSAALMKLADPARRVFAIDTFAGIPFSNRAIDIHEAGDFSDVDAGTIRFLESSGVEIIRGIFPSPAAPPDGSRFALAHFDGDQHRSCADFIAWFWPRLNPGGAMLFDDYRWPRCPGVALALEESFAPHDIERVTEFQALVRKR